MKWTGRAQLHRGGATSFDLGQTDQGVFVARMSRNFHLVR